MINIALFTGAISVCANVLIFPPYFLFILHNIL